MIDVHSEFTVILKRRHIVIIDKDNGIGVNVDLDYVVRTIRASHALKPHMKVLICDAFGAWDVIDFPSNGSELRWELRGLAADTEEEALRAA